MTKRITDINSIVDVIFLDQGSKAKVIKTYSSKAKDLKEKSLLTIKDNQDLLIELYWKYHKKHEDWIRYRQDVTSGWSAPELDWWNYVSHIIKEAGFKGEIRAKDLWEFYTQEMMYQCLYENIRILVWGENVSYAEKFKVYKNINKNEKEYTSSIAQIFIDKGFNVLKEAAIRVSLSNGAKINRFIDIIASNAYSVKIIECKTSFQDADVDQLSEYKLIIDFAKKKKNDQRFYSFFFVTQDPINYIPKGEYDFDIHSISSIKKTYFYERD